MRLCLSSHVFNRPKDKAVEGLHGVKKSVDDCLASGANDADLEKRLESLFRRMNEEDIKVSKRKFIIGSSIGFGGLKIKGSDKGLLICPDSEKIGVVRVNFIMRFLIILVLQ